MSKERIKGMVSAIMPTHNRAILLPKRIDEVLNQTYSNWELIIINDGSTDDTKQYLDSLKSPKIKVIHLPENSGSVSIPRAVGICQSQGEFIAPLDDDVGNLASKFEILVDAFQDDIVLTYGDRINFWPETNVAQKWAVIPDWNPLRPYGWGVDNGQMLYRVNVFNKVPIRFPKRACDWELAKDIKPLGNFKYINKLVSVYYNHTNNRSLDDSTKTRAIFPERFNSFYLNDYGFSVEYKS